MLLLDVCHTMDGSDPHAAYLAGHLPGAVWVDLDHHLAAPPTPETGRHPLPSPEAFAASMGELGVGVDATVVAYDHGIGAYAARLVWMLRVLGQDAALLDGGLVAWPGPLAQGEVRPDPVRVPLRPWPSTAIAELDEVVAASEAASSRIVDARAGERFRGEVEPIDPVAGHVPGAVNVPFAGNVDASGRFLLADELRARFAAAGVVPGDDVIAYCGSGVTACHDLLALERAGIPARLWPGSWSQWCGHFELPVATGQ